MSLKCEVSKPVVKFRKRIVEFKRYIPKHTIEQLFYVILFPEFF